jgi:hypothetical protein
VDGYIRTGSLGLDILLDGGWKRGALHDIWGEPGSGKTTLAEHAIWELEPGQRALWMSLGRELPHRPTGAAVGQPRNAEQAFYIMETVLGGSIDLVIVDSANGLIRKREMDGDPDYEPHPQREYKDELTSLKKVCKNNNSTVIFLSKPRDRDRQPIRGTGISEKAHTRVELRVVHQYQAENRDIRASARQGFGNDVGSTIFHMRPGTGIDWALEMAKLAVHYGVAEQRGSWIYCTPERYHGMTEFANEIEANTRLAVALDARILETAHSA